MNDITVNPRYRQKPIAFRSDKAARLLAEMTSDGRSQAQVIEEALEEAARSAPRLSPEEFIAQVKAIVGPAHGLPGRTYQEIRSEMYDEHGVPI